MTAVGQPPAEPRLQPAPLAKGLGTSPAATQDDSRPIKIAVDRLALTRRAHRILREHFVRAAVRVSVLLAGDAAALLLLRALLRGVRDSAWLGQGMSSVASRIIPQGAVPLVQLLPAVLLGLIALDTYGASDRRRDASRLVAGATLGLALPFWGHLWSNFTPLALPGFILLAALIGTTLIVERHLIDHLVRKLWPIGPGAVRALLIGRPADAARALEHPGLVDAREFTFGGVLDPDELDLKPHRGGFRRLCQTIKRFRADTRVLSGPL